MGAKDEEIILIHATVHYNERWSHFFCFYITLPPLTVHPPSSLALPHLHSGVPPPPVLPGAFHPNAWTF